MPDRQTGTDTIESTRLLGKIICLDPGHGGLDTGSTGATGTKEKDNTLATALLLRERLEKNGATVIMTRDSDKEASFAGVSPEDELGARVDVANDAGADIFISIHNDSFASSSVSGTTTYHYGDSESVRLAGLGAKMPGGRTGYKRPWCKIRQFLRYSLY